MSAYGRALEAFVRRTKTGCGSYSGCTPNGRPKKACGAQAKRPGRGLIYWCQDFYSAGGGSKASGAPDCRGSGNGIGGYYSALERRQIAAKPIIVIHIQQTISARRNERLGHGRGPCLGDPRIGGTLERDFPLMARKYRVRRSTGWRQGRGFLYFRHARV